jgi:hypothetical protein
MQPILADGRELAAEPLVEIFDDLGIALHGGTPRIPKRDARPV